MHLTVEERTYLTLVRVRGAVKGEDRLKLFQQVDGVLRSDPMGIVWDLSGSDSIADLPLSVLAGALAFQRLRAQPIVVMGAPGDVTERLRRMGVGYEVAQVSDEQEACLAILDRIPKRFDEFFCKVVVQEGFVDPGGLKQALLRFEREGKVGDFGKLLLREGLITAPQLLEAVCRQKTLLGDILVETGKLQADELDHALSTQDQMGTREKLGDLLMRLGLASNEDIYEALARQFKRRKRFKKGGGGAAAAGAAAQSSSGGAASSAEPGAPASPARSARLGEILLEQRLLSQEDLERSLQLQRQTQGREKLGDILVRLGFVSDSDLYTALLTQYERTQGGDLGGNVKDALQALIAKLGGRDHLVARQAMEGLRALGGPALAVVVASLRSPSPPVRRGCAEILGDAMNFESVPVLIELLEDGVQRVRNDALWSLIRITGQNFPPGNPAAWSEWWRAQDPTRLPRAPATISSHREEMARHLAKALEEGLELAPFDIEYRAGQEDWEGGHVRMQLRGDGIANVLHLKRGEVATYVGDLGTSETQEAFRAFSSAGILFVDTARSTDDGAETRHELALRIGNRYFRRSSLYYRELFQHWNFRSFESRLRDVLRRLTRGAIM